MVNEFDGSVGGSRQHCVQSFWREEFCGGGKK